jgi:RecB family exonuclease
MNLSPRTYKKKNCVFYVSTIPTIKTLAYKIHMSNFHPFLQQIAQDIALQYPDASDLRHTCMVFSTRRAGIYFSKYLAQQYANKAFFAPKIWSIVEFTEHFSESVVLDQVPLVLELFKTYSQIEPDVRFDSFYAWGKLILDDFDEIDRYMVDAAALFANLKDLRDVEEAFSLPAEQLPYLQQFWRVLQKENSTDLEREFIKIWEVLGQVYTAFRQALAAQNAAYMGMAQRQIVEQLEKGTWAFPFQKIFFAGFNDLTVTEQRIIDYLSQQQKAIIYWDTDRYYMQPRTVVNTAGRETHIPNRHEAGVFLRKYHQQYAQNPAHRWHTQTDFIKSDKKIDIVGIPLRVGQAKYAGQIIQQQMEQKQINAQNTALILSDETLLFPMLYALPPHIDKVNITMGYPFKHTPIYQLLEALIQLQKTRRDREVDSNKPTDDPENEANSPETTAPQTPHQHNLDKGKQQGEQSIKSVFYSKIVLQILNNPHLKTYDREAIEAYMSQAEHNNWVYVKPETICHRLPQPIFAIAFKRCENFLQIIEQFNQLLSTLFSDLQIKYGLKSDPNTKENETDEQGDAANDTPNPDPITADDQQSEEAKNADKYLDLEFIYHCIVQVRKLSDSLRRYRHAVSIDTFWKILREILQSSKLTFEGEPLSGLQILDFLEARTLDFKNLFILGMNEGLVPPSRPNATFIPVNLRRAFAMPTFLDQDAIYAYHFYRLLQRAENVWLLYNTETGNTGGEERSRYLLQLLYEIDPQNAPHIEIKQGTATAPISLSQTRTQPIIIPKTSDIREIMDKYVNQQADINPIISINRQAINAKHNTKTDDAQNLDSETLPVIAEYKQRLSPTAITKYINCPVNFYYEYIAQLKELSNIDEDINALIFGNVLHRCLELVYEKYKLYPITTTQIDRILDNPNQIENKLNKAFRDNNFEVPKEGNNLLLKRVLKRLVVQILETDKKSTPFSIVGLEASDYQTQLMLDDGRTIALHGTIDRIDQVTYPDDGLPTYRILDYKTGTVKIITSEKEQKQPPAAYFNKYFTDPDFKAGFQAYMYAYLFWVSQQRNARIIIGIYELKRINEGITLLRSGTLISNDFFEAFEQKLKTLLSELFNYDLPFIQTADLERYEYSPFKKLVSL